MLRRWNLVLQPAGELKEVRHARAKPALTESGHGSGGIASPPARTRNALNLPLDHHQLEFRNRLGRIEALRAGFCAVHDGVAAVEPERIFQIIEPRAGGFVARILDPARRLQQRGGAEKALAVPPIARARGRAASAENALIKPVELFAVLVALPPFLL